MINQLRKIYSSLLVYHEGTNHLDAGYKWFITEDQVIIGIQEAELTHKDTLLLSTFLSPYTVNFPIQTEEEQQWSEVIHSIELNPTYEFKMNCPYRFVYFSFNKNQITPLLFKDAIQELFSKQVPILWENDHEGIIIEKKTNDEESTTYDQIIDLLMSDLYVKIRFYVGPFKKDYELIKKHYHSVIKAAKTVFSYSTNKVITYIDAVPYLLIDQTEPGLRVEIVSTVLQDSIVDEETVKMIKTFVQCNLNISETAKVLHMHRNSLQYRLDRFFENTGTDIRQFHHAMTVYLALLARK